MRWGVFGADIRRERRGPRPPTEAGKPVLEEATHSKNVAGGIPEGARCDE
jgi:hypothetical protein